MRRTRDLPAKRWRIQETLRCCSNWTLSPANHSAKSHLALLWLIPTTYNIQVSARPLRSTVPLWILAAYNGGVQAYARTCPAHSAERQHLTLDASFAKGASSRPLSAFSGSPQCRGGPLMHSCCLFMHVVDAVDHLFLPTLYIGLCRILKNRLLKPLSACYSWLKTITELQARRKKTPIMSAGQRLFSYR